MLSWIRNLHTCKAETFSWHSEFWLVLGPHPPQAQQELSPGALQSILSALGLCCLQMDRWAAPAGTELCPGLGLLEQHPWML